MPKFKVGDVIHKDWFLDQEVITIDTSIYTYGLKTVGSNINGVDWFEKFDIVDWFEKFDIIDAEWDLVTSNPTQPKPKFKVGDSLMNAHNISPIRVIGIDLSKNQYALSDPLTGNFTMDIFSAENHYMIRTSGSAKYKIGDILSDNTFTYTITDIFYDTYGMKKNGFTSTFFIDIVDNDPRIKLMMPHQRPIGYTANASEKVDLSNSLTLEQVCNDIKNNPIDASKHRCICDFKIVFNRGCQCGGI